MRIVSLLPSTTEIVFDLGLADQLLGVTFECNFPTEARQGREIVVGGMDTKHLTPLEIDELVRARLAAGDELYSLDDDALAARLQHTSVVARAVPAHKLRIVQALRKAGRVVAMR
mgnify:CR=1 FL=1